MKGRKRGFEEVEGRVVERMWHESKMRHSERTQVNTERRAEEDEQKQSMGENTFDEISYFYAKTQTLKVFLHFLLIMYA